MHARAQLVMAFALLALAATCSLAAGQINAAAGAQGNYTFGNRPIDLLPKPNSARPQDDRDWLDPGPPADYELALHLKDLFRIGPAGIERLCVIEARHPQDQPGPVSLTLYGPQLTVLWQRQADWLGTNQRMRPYWLPVQRGLPLALALEKDGHRPPQIPAPLAENAPSVMFDIVPDQELLAVDAGIALLPASELVVVRGSELCLRIGFSGGLAAPVRIEVRDQTPGAEIELLRAYQADPRDARMVAEMTFLATQQAGDQMPIRAVATCGGQILAQRDYIIHLRDRLPEPAFGALGAALQFTAPILDGDRERTWHQLWGNSDKRDVVVSFPGRPYRLVFWRGASYVPCWALPEAWLTYEWLEAEPYFYGAEGCVEPLQDRDCRYSRVEITASSPARAIVTWRYALTDLTCEIIRGEHAEEIFTLYPDGVGTRYLRAFYQSGWHETQEFIVVNRPGSWPSMALDPQAITFYNAQGDTQAPVWPKPGFSLAGWPHVISVINLGTGPHPFMATPDAPLQTKVWADPYLDKPDLFNSYPHWPVTRGMVTSWLDDPAYFRRPTHTNLVNLVNDPVNQTEDEKDFLWLIGMAEEAQGAIDAGACWLQPGTVRSHGGVISRGYSQVERAYLLEAEKDARRCKFTLLPAPRTPVVNPAFVIQGWRGAAEVSVAGAEQIKIGREGGGLVIWARGRFESPTRVRIDPAG